MLFAANESTAKAVQAAFMLLEPFAAAHNPNKIKPLQACFNEIIINVGTQKAFDIADLPEIAGFSRVVGYNMYYGVQITYTYTATTEPSGSK
jgi:hypothetical protein